MSNQDELVAGASPRHLRNLRAGYVRLSVFVFLVMLALALVTVASRKMERPAPIPFDRRAASALKRARPEFVLIGNSMVGTRFDEAELRRLLRPRRVTVLGLSGTMSSGWYLAFKNFVIASGERPRVFLFFRQQELTRPRLWAEGPRSIRKVQRLSLPDEPTLTRRLAPPLKQPMARFDWYRERWVPIDLLRQKTEPWIASVGELGSRLAAPNSPEERARTREINELFALSNLRTMEASAEPATIADDTQVFEDAVGSSFLPDIIALAAENGVPLSFVRVRTRVAAKGEARTPAELRYDASIEQYFRAHGAEFYDLHDATWESIDMYGEGDHIAGNAKRRYTGLFVEHMGQIFH